jgi:S1-C subfamily serine protease
MKPRRLLTILILLSFFLLLPTTTHAEGLRKTPQAIYKEAAAYTVFIATQSLAPAPIPIPFIILVPQIRTGTGFVIDLGKKKSDFVVFTNYHVAFSGQKIFAHFNDRRRPQELALVGGDPITDIALLRFADHNFVPPGKATLGDANMLRVSENKKLYFFGTSMGTRATFAEGTLLKERIHYSGPSLTGSLLMHAPCNPGSSGEPVINEAGRIIGMVGGITRSPLPLCIAIPANTITALLPRLLTGGIVEHSYFGIIAVNSWELEPQERESTLEGKVLSKEGVLIQFFQQNSPAHNSGLHTGDIILGFSDNHGRFHPARDVGSFVEELKLTYYTKEMVSFKILRGKTQLTIGISPKKLVLEELVAPPFNSTATIKDF